MVGSSGSAGFRVTLYVGKRRRSGLDRRDAEGRALLEPRDDLGDVARGRAHQGRRDALQVMREEGARARAGEAVGLLLLWPYGAAHVAPRGRGHVVA